MKRSYFLKRFLTLLGISSTPSILLSSCETDEVIEDEEEVLTEEEIPYNELKDKTSVKGYFLEGKLLYIDISNEIYSKLNTVGEFLNDSENYILLLRKSEENIKAFSNCCPHLGASNMWSYNNGSFRCANHGNSFGTGTGFIVNCSSGSTSGNLKQYETELNQDILTVNFKN